MFCQQQCQIFESAEVIFIQGSREKTLSGSAPRRRDKQKKNPPTSTKNNETAPVKLSITFNKKIIMRIALVDERQEVEER